MTDIAIGWTGTSGDVVVVNSDLLTDDSLETAVLVSLFTDRRASVEQLPAGETDQRGYWGDIVPPVEGDTIGSLLWLLAREKATSETLSRAREYCQEALAWMIDDKIATSVDVAAEWIRAGVMGIAIQINRPDGSTVGYRYDYNWAAQAARAA